ncbi:peptidylprolyl isomerase [Paraglaciecola sp. 20A4]|uniref:peptidylprolyl isomerase n=1 Tax=Paraglaciecola sp. 20A4 TaxID=2687288 RepID=UPI00140A0A96|nr:peptidylprolyl isomerase [Paraglaciecola sp. 20A4]
MRFQFYTLAIVATLSSVSVGLANATEVQIKTVLGNVNVNLFDNTTPQTVANFLSYVDSGAYANNVVHRSEPGFVVQAGGFQYNAILPLDTVPTGSPVRNEPLLSNRRGTIAMAKLGGNADSATSQWFINVSDNSINLDMQNGGFTVFGQVLGEGMDIVDAIAALDRFNLGGAASAAPLRDYTQAQATAGVAISGDNLIIISDVVVVDTAIVTHSELAPATNTSLGQNSGGDSSSGGSGGSVGLWGLIVLAILGFRRKIFK